MLSFASCCTMWTVCEQVLAGIKLLDKPGAVIGSIPKNLRGQTELLAAGLRILEEPLVRILAVGRHGIIQGRARRGRQQTDQEQRRQDSRQAHARGKHGDNFIRARHPAQAEEQREQERDRQENDENLGDLGEIILQDQQARDALIEKSRDVVADVEDEPDRGEAGDAIEVGLEEIPHHVAIQTSHE